ncbi:TadE family protein [Actinotalea ferrariae]|uniref:TadE family protein n=1 Tax=Actinotalea ferrariae TaxID=1386098 RepID=UPI001C1E2C95|nr:TadE family protein [Actinotalea ferrariae]
MLATTPRTPAPTRRADLRATSRRHPGAARDAGSASVEVAILFPVVLLVITAIVQYGLWFHARSIALAAAQEGVTAARLYQADPAAGPDRARAFVETHGSDTLTEVTATATVPGRDQIGIQVTGRALSLLPGIPGLAVSQSAEGPVERFTTAGGP